MNNTLCGPEGGSIYILFILKIIFALLNCTGLEVCRVAMACWKC
jgi:hypothetical protein